MSIPTVPAVVTIKKMYNCNRSITIATYFQSSRVCKKRKIHINEKKKVIIELRK